MAGDKESEFLVVGRISGLHGVRGHVKVFSYTDPRENILNYSPWYLRLGGQWVARKLVGGRRQGKGIVARLEGYDDRDAAAALLQTEVAIRREQLPQLDEGDYYWSDLIGLQVVTLEGTPLGVVDHLLETGANDVLVVKGERERLIPFVEGVAVEVDLEAGTLQVDWDPEF